MESSEILRNAVKANLKELLGRVTDLFSKDELAYISLQQNNECQIRDKIAFYLQKAMDSTYPGECIVRCEWPSLEDMRKLNYLDSKISQRATVDIAVLKMNDEKTDYVEVLALVEFKTHLFLNREKWPYEDFSRDVNKMKMITQLSRNRAEGDFRIKNADLYFVMGNTSHDYRDKGNFLRYAPAITCRDVLALSDDKKSRRIAILYDREKPGVYEDELMRFWEGFCTMHFDFGGTEARVDTPYAMEYYGVKCQDVPERIIQRIGSSFGYNMYQTFLVWGPYRADRLRISPNMQYIKKKTDN